MGSSYRVSIYSQDSLGLGHLRRNIPIGGAFLKATKDSNVLLFADSPVAPFFTLPSVWITLSYPPSARSARAAGKPLVSGSMRESC